MASNIINMLLVGNFLLAVILIILLLVLIIKRPRTYDDSETSDRKVKQRKKDKTRHDLKQIKDQIYGDE